MSLDSSSRIDFTHLRDLNAPELRVLSVKNCYRIDDRAIEVLTDSSGGFSNLVEIYLDYTRITSLSLQLICKFYKGKLEKLSLKGCKVLSVDEKMRNYIKHSLTDCQTILE